jgi:hypothetical protein
VLWVDLIRSWGWIFVGYETTENQFSFPISVFIRIFHLFLSFSLKYFNKYRIIGPLGVGEMKKKAQTE